MKIIGIPFGSKEGEVERNVDEACQIIRDEVNREHADLVVLPELFTCGYCDPNLQPYAEGLDGRVARRFAELAESLDTIVGYGFAECTGERRVHNSFALIEPGKTPHVYRKSHLHPTTCGDKANEPDFLLPGQSLDPFETRLGKIGVMICYDGCFPEVARVLVLKGAELILWPSRSGGYLASRSLPQVRSLDNVVDVVQVEGGQTGSYLPLEAWSIVCSAKGEVLVSQKNDPTPLRVELDLEVSKRLRASAAAGAHSLYVPRRPELYGIIAEPSS